MLDQVIVITDGQNNVGGHLKNECLSFLDDLKKEGVDVEFVGVNGLNIQESCDSYGICDKVRSSQIKSGDAFRGLVALGQMASQRIQKI